MTIDNKQTWQNTILNQFRPKKEPMLVVIDPDMLLSDETLLAEIQNSSYDILKLEDEVTFRNRFERNYRTRWDAGEPRHVVIIVHTSEKERHIPYDLLQKGKKINVSVSELFPNLNALVIQTLDQAYYQDLYVAHQSLVDRNEIQRGERQTMEFILRTVFGIEPATEWNPIRIVELLMDFHYRGRKIPQVIITCVNENMAKKIRSVGISKDLFDQSINFYSWLTKEWAKFCSKPESDNALNFRDLRQKTLLTNLFADGKLDRVMVTTSTDSMPSWMRAGIEMNAHYKTSTENKIGDNLDTSIKSRVIRFANMKDEEFPQGSTDLRDWLNLAAEWAEVINVVNQLPKESYDLIQLDFYKARNQINTGFVKFVQSRYSAVDYYQDNKGPVSLASINSWLNQQYSLDDHIALICFDGLSLDQWFLLKKYLVSQLTHIDFRENRTYALAPSLTSISRQSLFAGRRPDSFADTWDKTNKDAERWQSFWINKGVAGKYVSYLPLKTNDLMSVNLQEAIGKNIKRLGILINTFDDVMHSTKGFPENSDKRILYSSLQGYLADSKLSEMINFLLENQYRIIITADHGNICAHGSGITPPKAFIETYARRVAIFGEEKLAREFAEQNDALYFRTKSLPTNLFPVYYSDFRMYNSSGSVEISHGGLSLEELVVPFIEVSKK